MAARIRMTPHVARHWVRIAIDAGARTADIAAALKKAHVAANRGAT